MKTRVISAIIALIIVLPIIIIGGLPFFIGASIIGFMGFLEILKLIDKERKIPYLMKSIGVVTFIVLMMNNWDVFGINFLIDYEVIIATIMLILIPVVFYNSKKVYNIEDAFILLSTILFLGISFNQLVNIRTSGLDIFIFLLLITIFTDTFAYITGMLIGKHKMCPSVSPKKTWEGFVGGLIFGTFISTVFYISVFDYTGSILTLILIISILSIIGQLGDLVFSSIKRYYGIKDFGNIMPGHGGILDRLDSILFVVLAFTFVVRFL